MVETTVEGAGGGGLSSSEELCECPVGTGILILKMKNKKVKRIEKQYKVKTIMKNHAKSKNTCCNFNNVILKRKSKEEEIEINLRKFASGNYEEIRNFV